MEKITCGKQTFYFKDSVPNGFSIHPLSDADEVEIYELILDSAEEMGNIEFVLRFPMEGILSVYSPTLARDRSVHQWFGGSTSDSNFYFGAPILCVVRDGNRNVASVALADAVNDCRIQFYVNDYDERETVEFKVHLLTGSFTAKQYHTILRLDQRDLPLEVVTAGISQWWKEFYPPHGVLPPTAEEPLYSTWYNFHQHPNQQQLMEELKIAAHLGFKTVILDDGWHFDGHGTRDFSLCGGWMVSKEKFPDFRGFVDAIHGLGMKILLWFSLPFIGLKHPYYERFKDRMLYTVEGALMVGVLDPRYASVREYVTEVLCRYIREYDLDGFKVDFLDTFRMVPEAPLATTEMDETNLSLAVIRLLSETEQKLSAIKTPLMMEYRQNYVGPAINSFGQMLRVCDCAFESQTNRIYIADLRLLHYDVAVHSDMLYWSKSETPENCARQLINTLFAVPQISVLLKESTEDQLCVIRYYLKYWVQNRRVILHGEFNPGAMDFNYPVLESATKDKRIIAIYTPFCVLLDERETDVFNATASTGVVFNNRSDRARTGAIFDCIGNKTACQLPANSITECTIPVGGHIELQ